MISAQKIQQQFLYLMYKDVKKQHEDNGHCLRRVIVDDPSHLQLIQRFLLVDSRAVDVDTMRSLMDAMLCLDKSVKELKGSFSYKLLADDEMRGDCNIASSIMDLSHTSIVASSLLGSIIIFVPISRDEYKLLEDVQSRISIHPLTAPILGNNHTEYRSRQSSAGVPRILDGDMLAQFLELTNTQQEDVLALPRSPLNIFTSKPPFSIINVNKVVRLLERVHNALN